MRIINFLGEVNREIIDQYEKKKLRCILFIWAKNYKFTYVIYGFLKPIW